MLGGSSLSNPVFVFEVKMLGEVPSASEFQIL
jgi:hypothetical protein